MDNAVKTTVKETIKAAVKEAMDEKMADLWVERETHYKHHEFISEMIKWTDAFKSTTMKAIINCFVGGIIIAMAIGFAVWGGKQLK